MIDKEISDAMGIGKAQMFIEKRGFCIVTRSHIHRSTTAPVMFQDIIEHFLPITFALIRLLSSNIFKLTNIRGFLL